MLVVLVWNGELQFQSKKSKAKEREKRVRGEPSSLFQRRRVNMILDLMTKKFPPKLTPPAAAAPGACPREEVKEEKQQEAAKEPKTEKVEVSAANSSGASAQASTAGIKREAGQGSRGPEAKKSKMS